MSCDLCGATGQTTLVKIEGMPYNVCQACASYGTPVQEVARKRSREVRIDDRVVRSDIGTHIRNKRQTSGKTMQEFAQFLAVKESDVHAWETGHRTPTVEMAEKLGKRLSFNPFAATSDSALIQTSYDSRSSSESEGMTIADLLKKK